MIKIYLDWGVISSIKQSNNADLVRILFQKKQFFIIYSTSHISDILVSNNGTEQQNTLIEEDLSYITLLTDNFCAHTQDDKVVISQLDPKILFEERLWQAEAFSGNGLFDFLLKEFEPDSDQYKALKNYLDSPIPYEITQAFNNPLIADQMRFRYPGLEENPTLENLINIGWKQVRALNETEAYGELRKTLQQGLGINRDKIFADEDPFTFIDKIYGKLEERIGFSLKQSSEVNSNSPKWFQNITENYIKLDMHGYQEDKIKAVGDSRKQTMRNTIDDGFHAAFSSMCDFYIVDDKKSKVKSKEVFKKLNLNTKVLSSGEFIEHYNAYLKYDNVKVHRQLWFEILKCKDYIITQEAGGTLLSYYFNYFVFDYFNKCHILVKEEFSAPVIFLSKDKPTNNNFIYRNELVELITKLNFAFETNISSSDHISPEDISNDNWKDYNWNWGGYGFRLVQREGYLQLYLDII